MSAGEGSHSSRAHADATYLLWLLEAFLDLTNQFCPQKLSAESFETFDRLILKLIGAIHNPHFYFSAHRAASNRLIHRLGQIRKALAESFGVNYTNHIEITNKGLSPQVIALCRETSEYNVLHHKVRYWQSWACRNGRNTEKLTFPPLAPILNIFGQDFTDKLDKICINFHEARRAQQPIAVKALAQYCNTLTGPISKRSASDPDFTGSFFLEEYENYLNTGLATGNRTSLRHLVKQWRGPIKFFFETQIFPRDILRRPAQGLPYPKSISAHGLPTHVDEGVDGLIHKKLLTPVPLDVSDDQASQLIFTAIERDLNRTVDWAMSEVRSLDDTIRTRDDLSLVGSPRNINSAVSNSSSPYPKWDKSNFSNVAATFRKYGYMCGRQDIENSWSIRIHRSTYLGLADKLGLPTSYVLVPHCAALMAEHPKITVSFLEEFELYDSDGTLIGLDHGDSTTRLIGYKYRKGARLAQQSITLTERSLFIVQALIRCTKPLRDFLRLRGDRNFRFLLLSSGQGFGYPHRVPLGSLTSRPGGLGYISRSFKTVMSVSKQEAAAFASNLSLTAVRASAAVLVYFKTGSVKDMADALGHEDYEPRLLDRYLPKALRHFFEERWIRLFQCGIVVEALKGSEYQLQASGFQTISDLENFIAKNAISLPAELVTPPMHIDEDDLKVRVGKEVVFALNEEILVSLISLGLAKNERLRPLNSKALYWATVGEELIKYVEVSGFSRPDIQQYLQNARAIASSHLVSHIAHDSH